MRFRSAALACVLLLPTLASAQADPKAEVRSLFLSVSERFEAALQDVSVRQWNYRAPNQRHTIGALAEHAAISANDLQKMVQSALDAGPNPDVAKTLDGKTQVVKDIMLSVETPPENFRPAGRLVTKTDINEYFPQVKAKALALVDSSRYLELCIEEHPSERVGWLTGTQWVHYISYLIQAHTEQIERIKKDPGYPAS